MVSVIVVAMMVAGASAQSISSCGGSSDHLQNAVFKVSPDPPVKGQPLTLTFSGTADEDFVGGSFATDLQVSVLGIKKSVKNTTPFSVSPAMVKGPQVITIGPFTLPSNVPGSAMIKGTVKIVNPKNEPIACTNLNLDLPAMEEVQAASAVDAVPTSCGKDSDHMKNLKIVQDSGVTDITGTLDEALTKLDVKVALKIHEIFSIPINLDIPVSATPGIPSGDFKLSAGPSTPSSADLEAGLGVSVTGTVTINDGNNEEVACLSVGSSEELKATTNPTHYGDPKTGCESGEKAVQMHGLSGDFCSPLCLKPTTSMLMGDTCPSDVPAGVTAKPTCALRSPTGDSYCALICSASELHSNGANGECGTGTCQTIQGTGICTYATSNPGLASILVMPAEQTQLII